MKLTTAYIDNKDADVFVYFHSNRFGADRDAKPASIDGYHGQALSEWLRSKLQARGFTVFEPSPTLIGWRLIYENCHYTWRVDCENIPKELSDQWSITINSTTKNPDGTGGVSPQECLDFLLEIKQILESDEQIKSIQWNRDILNQPVAPASIDI